MNVFSILPCPSSVDMFALLGAAVVILVGGVLVFAIGRRFLGGLYGSLELPGPVGWPLIGSLGEILRYGHCQILREWRRQYGEVIRVSLGRREAVIINTYAALKELIMHQGAAFQSRPVFKLFHSDFASNGIWTIGTSPWSSTLKNTRKAFAAQILPHHLLQYVKFTDPKLKLLIRTIFKVSDGEALDVADLLHRYGSGQITDLLFGTHIDGTDTSLIAENETDIFRMRTIGFPLRDYVPCLRYWERTRYWFKNKFYRWQASDSFGSRARELRTIQGTYITRLLSDLHHRIEHGDDTPSILGNIIRCQLLDDTELMKASLTGIAAGINLGYAFSWIIIYLASRPDLQNQGYEAIRERYGGRVPDPHISDEIEFVKALYLEGSRMYTPVRLGFPRESLEGGSYRGKRIPRGTLVVTNLYACNHDPAVFDRPEEFLPERWLSNRKGHTQMYEGSGYKTGISHLMYGAGRRVCPGIALADSDMYGLLVLFLHFFSWKRQPLSEAAKKNVFPPFRAAQECSLEVDPLRDVAAPTEPQAIPWAAGISFHCRVHNGLSTWLN